MAGLIEFLGDAGRELAGSREDLIVLIGLLREADPGPQPDRVRLPASLGTEVRADLADPDPAVRLRAVLADEADPVAREIILAALPDPPPPGTHRCELVARGDPGDDRFPGDRRLRLHHRGPGQLKLAPTTSGVRWCGTRSPGSAGASGG